MAPPAPATLKPLPPARVGHLLPYLHVLIGSTGSGKSTHIRNELRRLRPRRTVIWDRKREYSDIASYRAPTLADAIRAMGGEVYCIVYTPPADPKAAKREFDLFCHAAYVAGNLVLVAEELSVVTSSQSAPPWWSECTSGGRHVDLLIYATSQRPAALDGMVKDNATRVRTGRLNTMGSIETMADMLMVDKGKILTLQPMEFIERDTNTGEIGGGFVKRGG